MLTRRQYDIIKRIVLGAPSNIIHCPLCEKRLQYRVLFWRDVFGRWSSAEYHCNCGFRADMGVGKHK